jgi:hypothetical protein
MNVFVEAASCDVQLGVVNCLCSCCKMLSPILQCGSYRMIENSFTKKQRREQTTALAGKALTAAEFRLTWPRAAAALAWAGTH